RGLAAGRPAAQGDDACFPRRPTSLAQPFTSERPSAAARLAPGPPVIVSCASRQAGVSPAPARRHGSAASSTRAPRWLPGVGCPCTRAGCHRAHLTPLDPAVQACVNADIAALVAAEAAEPARPI